MALEVTDPERRDQDLSSVVEAWALLDGELAWEVSHSIIDPFLRSWTLADLALSVRNQDRAGNIIREAWKTARSISSPYTQGKAFARISAAGARILPREKKFWEDEVTSRVRSIRDPNLRVMVLRDVIMEWTRVDGEQAEKWTGDIPPEFSEARAYSFFLLAQRPGIPPSRAIPLLKKALAETGRIADPFQSQRIKALAGKEMAKLDPEGAFEILSQVADPLYRSEILGGLADRLSLKEPGKALAAAERIPLQPLRDKTVVKIIGRGMEAELKKVDSLYLESLQAARSIPDAYSRALTLIELGNDWNSLEKGREIAPFESALKAAGEISSPPLRAEVLEGLASAWKNSDPEKGESVRKGIDASVLTVRKSLEEIRLWAQAEPLRAKRWAEAIPAAFSYEKAMALKEVADKLKKSQPQVALGVFETALEQALAMPDGAGQTKSVSEIISDVASLDKGWTCPDDGCGMRFSRRQASSGPGKTLCRL
jgi:hypothetical protein